MEIEPLSQDWIAIASVKKPSLPLQYLIQAVGVLLNITQHDELPTPIPYAMRISKWRYEATLAYLCENKDDVFTTLSNCECTLEQEAELFYLLESNEYIQERNCFIPGQDNEVLQKLSQVVARYQTNRKNQSQRLSLTSNFLVAVDGSRLAHYGFEIATERFLYGSMTVMYVESLQEGNNTYPSAFIASDYENAGKVLNLNCNTFKVYIATNLLHQGSIGNSLVHKSVSSQINYIVLGSYGNNGPRIQHPGSTTLDVIESAECTVLVVSKLSSAGELMALPCEKQKSKHFLIAIHATSIPIITSLMEAARGLLHEWDHVTLWHLDGVVLPDSVESTLNHWKIKYQICKETQDITISVPEQMDNAIISHKVDFTVVHRSASMEDQSTKSKIGQISKKLLQNPRSNMVIAV